MTQVVHWVISFEDADGKVRYLEHYGPSDDPVDLPEIPAGFIPKRIKVKVCDPVAVAA